MQRFRVFGLLVIVAVMVGVSMMFVGCGNRRERCSPRFTNDVVLVTLTSEASYEVIEHGRVFAVNDFPEVELESVRVKFDLRVVILSLRLLHPSVENVLNAIEALKVNEYVKSASPNWLYCLP